MTPVVDNLSFRMIVLLCAISFLIYSIKCLVSAHMKREFARYGMERYRRLTGLTQFLAVVGLSGGLIFPLAGAAAAAGLTTQMLLALVVRRRINDGVRECLPAFIFGAVNAWLLTGFLSAV